MIPRPLGREKFHFNLLKIEITDLNSEQVREVLKLLRQDHYLKRNEQGEEGFYFSLIKRWWCLDRGLS
jgi:hypothetical protein